MRIFVDVGAHEGQTIEEVVKPEWEFDLVYALEPMPREFRLMRRNFRSDPRVQTFERGLAAEDGTVIMYGNNKALEASLFENKNDVDSRRRTIVRVLDAANFMEALPEGEVFVNMNCEGAELPILMRLLDSGAIKRITALLVDFDIRKVPGLEAHEDDLRSGLDASGITWTCEYPDAETHQEQIAAWLRGVL